MGTILSLFKSIISKGLKMTHITLIDLKKDLPMHIRPTLFDTPSNGRLRFNHREYIKESCSPGETQLSSELTFGISMGH